MQRIVIAGLIGLMFGAGIAISGMGNPAKVLNFFDFAGTWDPSMLVVMGSALVVTAIGYRLVLRRAKPVCEAKFHLPGNRKLDVPLVAGSAVFKGGSVDKPEVYGENIRAIRQAAEAATATLA